LNPIKLEVEEDIGAIIRLEVFCLEDENVSLDAFQDCCLGVHPPVDRPAQDALLPAKLVEQVQNLLTSLDDDWVQSSKVVIRDRGRVQHQSASQQNSILFPTSEFPQYPL
jgi:hypothetical protein